MEREMDIIAIAKELEMSAEEAQDVGSPDTIVAPPESIPGVTDILGRLPAGSIITESALAKIMKRHPVSVKRAVQRRELPPPVRLFGTNVWLAGSILTYLQKRLDTAVQEADRERRRLESHRP